MLIEQAFHNLPEILVGSGYAKQDYQKGFEASIVGAFSLAVLQELNGRNAPNPISFLFAEKRYPDIEPNLRADLFVNLSRLFTGSEDYADFGFRFSNWIEAKYFRKTGGTPPITSNLGLIVADLLRLIVLVPKEDHGRAGRYFLHVYKGDPLKMKLIKVQRDDGTKREWVEKLLAAGDHEIKDLELSKEQAWPSFFKHLGTAFDSATCELAVTNYRIVPPHKTDDPSYTLILTRINSAKLVFNGTSMTLNADRTVVVAPVVAALVAAAHVAAAPADAAAAAAAAAKVVNDFRRMVADTMKPKKPRKKRAKKAANNAAPTP
jgi:hypothetical protein